MNAVMARTRDFESELMAINEKNDLATQVGELRADVRHIQSDVSDIKADLRATNQRTDSLRDKIDALREKMDERFEKTEAALTEIKGRLASWKVWAIGLYAGFAGAMFLVLAKGFKWF